MTETQYPTEKEIEAMYEEFIKRHQNAPRFIRIKHIKTY